MDSFEINKIITAIFLVVLVVFGVGKISDLIFEVKKPNIEGYKVEGKIDSSTAELASTESKVDVAALLAITPSRTGLTVSIFSGVFPIICLAGFPALSSSPLFLLMATTDGWSRTIPCPERYIKVLAVPRSMPIEGGLRKMPNI